MTDRKSIRLAYLVTHPIQYQVPLLRLIAGHPGLQCTTFFLEDTSGSYFDEGFGQRVQWDIPLLEGYRYKFLAKGWRSALNQHLQPANFDVLWVHGYSQPAHVCAIRTAASRGIKVLLRGESMLHTGTSHPLLRPAKNAFLRWCFALCSAFLYIGSKNREFYRAHSISDARLFPVPYAVDNDFFRSGITGAAAQREDLRKSLGLQLDQPIVLFAGKLIPHKGPMDLLEAHLRLTAAVPHYLLFAGSGEEQPKLEGRAAQANLQSVRFLGFQNQSQLPSLFDLCDLFVLPSTFEPWGLVVNEVMNAAKPVIVSDIAGCAADLVEEDRNGWTFQAGNVDSLTAVLRRALSVPEQLRAMGCRSLERIDTWSYREDLQGLLAACRYAVSESGGVA